MKRNVDLTENELFSSNIAIERIRRGIPRIRLSKYPWYHTMGEDSMEQEEIAIDKWGVYQGNRSNRFTKKICNEQEFGMGIYCDCCGRKLFPWLSSQYLCSSCNKQIEDVTERKVSERLWKN